MFPYKSHRRNQKGPLTAVRYRVWQPRRPYISPLLFSLKPFRRKSVAPKPRAAKQRAKMVQRLTYRSRHSYATKSNQHRVVKTPGTSLSLSPIFTISVPDSNSCVGSVTTSFCCLSWVDYLRFWIVGGKLVYQTTKKRASGPKCPVTGKRIQGVWFYSPLFLINFCLCSYELLG